MVDNDKHTPSKKTSPHGTPYTFRGEHLNKSGYIRKMKATYRAESTMIATSSAAVPRQLTQKELLLKRAAILDERSDNKLSLKDKAVFQYREERQLQYWGKGQSTMGQDAFNYDQYDAEQFAQVQELLDDEMGDNEKKNGDCPAGQECR
jgi:hypothetical protein